LLSRTTAGTYTTASPAGNRDGAESPLAHCANLGSAAALSASSVYRTVNTAATGWLCRPTGPSWSSRDGHNPHLLERTAIFGEVDRQSAELGCPDEGRRRLVHAPPARAPSREGSYRCSILLRIFMKNSNGAADQVVLVGEHLADTVTALSD
jgi:hypothetical protein